MVTSGHNWMYVCAGWWLGAKDVHNEGQRFVCVLFYAHACYLSPVGFKTWQRFVLSAHNLWHFTDLHWNGRTGSVNSVILCNVKPFSGRQSIKAHLHTSKAVQAFLCSTTVALGLVLSLLHSGIDTGAFSGDG